AELEATLGEPLFLRGIEGTQLTAFAERLVEPARRMAESAGEVARLAERSDARPEGVVRITAPPGVAYEFLAPFALLLRSRLPGVRLEVIATLQYLDLARREADLALRMQRPTQKELTVIAELVTEVGAFASPAYAAKLPKRCTLADIDWIGWAPPLDHLSPNRELAALIPGFRPVFASDDFIVQLAAANAGVGAICMGIVSHPGWRRELLELDVDIGPVRGYVCLACAKSALAIPRIRAVADLLATELTRTAAPKRKARR
ncbi:MAG: LysR family transcriptional regulator, partial [Myxococcales bacterium]|nr:LysR family transcriptional regulator [Myxococcales bacterium]